MRMCMCRVYTISDDILEEDILLTPTKSQSLSQISEQSDYMEMEDLSNVMESENEKDKLFDLWKRTEEKVEELESNYLTTCHMKNEPVSVILVGLWRQTVPGSELRKRLEKMLMDSPDVQRIDFDGNYYSFMPLK